MGNSISSVQPTSSIHHYGTIDKQEKSTIRFNIVKDSQKDSPKYEVVKDAKTNDSYHSL
jgi:hypothetical protein